MMIGSASHWKSTLMFSLNNEQLDNTRGCQCLHMSAWDSWMHATLTDLSRILIVHLISVVLYLVAYYIADTAQLCSTVPREVLISTAAYVCLCGNVVTFWKDKSLNNWCMFELCIYALSHWTLVHFYRFKHIWVSLSKLILSVDLECMVAYFSVLIVQ